MRKSGYYRVKYLHNWEIAYWLKEEDVFFLMGIRYRSYKDSDFDKDPITGEPMIDPNSICTDPMNKERKSGLYRVKFNGEWTIAQFLVGLNAWGMIGAECLHKDSDFDKDPLTREPMIDPNPINPKPQ
ncbi:MAG: hypothetical protein NVS9B7_29240 [Flavisolibacter sp.]